MDNKQFVAAFRQSLKASDAVSAAKVGNYLDHQQYSTLAKLWCDPREFDDADLYYQTAQHYDLLRKAEFLPGLDEKSRNAATYENWLASERQCCETNSRWWVYTQPDYAGPFELVLRELRKEVKRILGPFRSLGDPIFTNGATSSDRTGYTHQPDKINSQPVCYPAAWKYISADLFNCSWGRHLKSIGIEDHHGVEFRRYNGYSIVTGKQEIGRAHV